MHMITYAVAAQRIPHSTVYHLTRSKLKYTEPGIGSLSSAGESYPRKNSAEQRQMVCTGCSNRHSLAAQQTTAVGSVPVHID